VGLWKKIGACIPPLNQKLMSNNINISIPKPCHEEWDRFTPTQKGRFCRACKKEVIDFTNWKDEDIKHYFLSNTKSACGRFKATQLKNHSLLNQKLAFFNWAAVFTFFIMIISRNAESQVKREQVKAEQLEKKGKVIHHAGYREWKIEGVVRDQENAVLPGVNVLQKNSTYGTVTDAEGYFKITIVTNKATETLSFSFIGFNTKDTVIYKSQNSLNIVMKVDEKALTEVVIVGGVCATRSLPKRIWWRIKNVFN
jgi:hypothetical protein